MLNEESQDESAILKLNREISQCSTAGEFSTVYEELFFVGPDGEPNNHVKLHIEQQKLSYWWNSKLYELELPLTVLEESIYLRNHITVFAIKLTHGTETEVVSTYQKDHFISLYVRLANKCILTGFDKHYKVGKHIGTGTYGKVYDGYNLFSNENVALKVISKAEASKAKDGLETVYNEIRILEKLKKHHISPLISTYESVDCFILVLEKGNGGSLIDYLRSQPHQYNEKMLKSILKQLLENVAILHEAGFIHRDIKPQNIICKDSSSPSIFLCDYGISIEKDQKYGQIEDHHIAGTIGYIAPEIINEENYDEKCDIFSIGSLFFYLFTGKKLFDSKNLFELRALNETSDYVDERLDDLNGLGFEVRDIMENLLKFSCEERFSAKEALRHPYFNGFEPFLPNCGEFDETLRSFIQNKVSHYWE